MSENSGCKLYIEYPEDEIKVLESNVHMNTYELVAKK